MKSELTNETAVKMLKMRTGIMPEVCQIAMECNWGAPVSGRFDTDYLLLWAAAKCEKDAKVYIYGRHTGTSAWNIKTELLPGDELINGYRLFKAEIHSQFEFPEEYVILMEKDSQSYYDNNNQKNYYITPYAGCTSSFITGGDKIYVFNDNTRYKPIML